MSHPRFAEARATYLDQTLAVYETRNFPGQMKPDAERVILIGIFLALWAKGEASGRPSRLSLTRVKGAVAEAGLFGQRQVDDIVARLVQTGHVIARADAADARLRILEPGEPLLAWNRSWLRAYHEPLQLLYPDPGFARALDPDPAFQRAILAQGLDALPAANEVLAHDPAVSDLYGRPGAFNTLLSMVRLQRADPESRFRESQVAVLAQPFGVSRSHVRNIIQTATERNLLSRSPDAQADIRVAPRGLDAADRFIADTLRTSEVTYRAAERRADA